MRGARLLAAVAPILLVALAGCGAAGSGTAGVARGDAALARAFNEHANDLEAEGQGTVARVLADDDEGARHQRFILRLDSGQTLLVAHNIDIAPRIEGLAAGGAAPRGAATRERDQQDRGDRGEQPGADHSPSQYSTVSSIR